MITLCEIALLLATHSCGAHRKTHILLQPLPSHDVSLTCPDCGTQVAATRDFIGREISCPACLASITVPADADRARPQSRPADQPSVAATTSPLPCEPTQTTPDDSYRLAFFGDDKPISPPIAPQQLEETEEAETFSLAAATGRSSEADDAVTYSLGQQVERPPVKIEVFKAISHVKREQRPPPPQSLFFSNVFQFPWSSAGAVLNWGYLTIGLTLQGLLGAFCVWLLETMGRTGWLGIGFICMGLVWVGLWSLSFASSLSVAIVTETAAGMDRVEGWGEGGWRDWLFDFMLLLWIYVFSGFVCMPLALLLRELIGVLSPQLVVMQFFVFPALWLSAMDSESVLIPFSSIVFGSLRRIPGTWLKFYGLVLALLIPSVTILAVTSYFSAWAGALIGGPVWASIILIYARLLGRLGYAVITAMEKPESPKSEQATKSPTKTKQAETKTTTKSTKKRSN